MWRGWLTLLGLTLGIGGAMTAHASWTADRPTPKPMQAGRPAAAIAGATGTLTPPPLPIQPAAAEALGAAEPAVVAARPFSLGRAGAGDRARAMQCLTDAIYYEAASEPDEGQRAVAQVILNRVRHPAFPPTVCGVVYQGSERGGCQFSFACNGAMARAPSRIGWARAARTAAAALAGYVYAPVGLATHYHTYAVAPAWNRTLVMTDAVGAHFFHRWKGYGGTAAAFDQRYAGGEPLPVPHTPVVLALPVAMAILPSLAQTGVATTPAVTAQGDRLPPASTVLDRWQDSGKPL